MIIKFYEKDLSTNMIYSPMSSPFPNKSVFLMNNELILTLLSNLFSIIAFVKIHVNSWLSIFISPYRYPLGHQADRLQSATFATPFWYKTPPPTLPVKLQIRIRYISRQNWELLILRGICATETYATGVSAFV